MFLAERGGRIQKRIVDVFLSLVLHILLHRKAMESQSDLELCVSISHFLFFALSMSSWHGWTTWMTE